VRVRITNVQARLATCRLLVNDRVEGIEQLDLRQAVGSERVVGYPLPN
jgi:hypothetical protein